MKLSVIIVNYNVKHFLEQCLYSVIKSAQGKSVEIFVVDNNSVDGSCNMLREKFPDITLIENKQNMGFSYANNQAIKLANGEYILLLNPDTVLEEDTFSKILSFMDMHPDAGGLGVKMIDGKGHFLPESKRGLPTPMVAFYKIFGFSKLFPKSKKFGKYHLGFLNKEETHEVDVLSGAFMLLRKSVLDTIGLLDESFFMYGEDIDLSYRITRAGYKNYYFPETTIIHYKGESTKKGSVNYVLVFYNAMIIFAKKHFTAENAKLFSFLINTAIYFRAFIAIVSRFFKTMLVPILDSVLIYLGFYLIKPFWESYKFAGHGTYPEEYLKYIVPLYVFAWIFSLFFTGGYDKPVRIVKLLKGVGAGTFIILIIYSLLSEEFRFSRALILFGTAWTFSTVILLRTFFHLLKIKGYNLNLNKKKRVVIIGNKDEVERISSLLKQTDANPLIVGAVCPQTGRNDPYFIGNIEQINEVIRINTIEEIIYSARDVSTQTIIKNMLDLSSVVDYKIASPDSVSVIGSNSIDTAGDLYTVSLNSITKAINKRNKRLLDIIFSFLFLIISPLLFIVVKQRSNLFYNIFTVLTGLTSWVGYKSGKDIQSFGLPKIKKGVLNPADIIKSSNISPETIEKVNIDYAKNYKVLNDLAIIFKNLKHIGR